MTNVPREVLPGQKSLLLQHLGLIRSNERLRACRATTIKYQADKIFLYFESLPEHHRIGLSLKHLNGLTEIPPEEVPKPVTEYTFLSIDHRDNLSGKT